MTLSSDKRSLTEIEKTSALKPQPKLILFFRLYDTPTDSEIETMRMRTRGHKVIIINISIRFEQHNILVHFLNTRVHILRQFVTIPLYIRESRCPPKHTLNILLFRNKGNSSSAPIIIIPLIISQIAGVKSE